ncbi:hypothetical protein FOS14_07705 [Skermania sp. ID1734]|uniref:hypothetical protein n=1 Tax=Skermania sp. ID1734 TaxID=2597516 RepID=UPI00117E5297|nr:hypothetical protein [Skermania sp. ID1734]TSE00305.1 hypothetical protein FOS14_07705 [Skermania sp. ID1734]
MFGKKENPDREPSKDKSAAEAAGESGKEPVTDATDAAAKPEPAAAETAGETAGVSPGAPDPEVPAEEPETAEAETSRKRSPLLKLIAAGVAGVVFVAAVVIAILASWNWKKLHDEKQDGQAASATACEYAKKLATYDYNNLDAFFKGILTGVTGEAKQRFDETSKSEDLKNFLKQAQVKSQVDDTECGVKSVDGDNVTVVISITGKQGSLGTQGQMVPRQIGVLATLQKVDGQWLVSKLDAPFLQQ